ncbi:MAG: hypothetical protein GY926_02810, partial [bacterium]|nr:hypothetical protein [bacterium]
GRRSLVRDTFRALIDDPKSLAAHGAIGGVVLTGMGGSGKTTVAGRVVSRLRERGWSVAGVRGRLSVTDLAVSIGQALPDLAARLEAAVEDTETVGLICEVVAGQRIVLVFDDFEVNLDPGTGGFREESTQAVMAALADAADAGKLLITSRYPPEGLDDLLDYPVGPLTASETARLSWRLSALNQLDSADLTAVLRGIGGHPRMLEFVDAALRRGRSSNRAITRKIRDLAQQHGIDVKRGARSVDDATMLALELGMRDIMLTELVEGLEEHEQQVLLQAAVSNLAVTPAFVAHTVPETISTEDVDAGIARLVESSLLTPLAEGIFYVHRWTAEGLRALSDESEHIEQCRRAARYRLQPDGKGVIDLTDAEEAVRLYLSAGDHNEASDLGLNILQYLASEGESLRLIALAGEILDVTGIQGTTSALIAQAEAQANLQLGVLQAAIRRWEQINTHLTEQAASDPTNTGWQRDLSVSHDRLGDFARAVRGLETARTHYDAPLAIRERLAASDPTNTEWQRDLSISHNKLGDFARAVGDLETARTHYETTLAIGEARNIQDTIAAGWSGLASVENGLGHPEGSLDASLTALSVRIAHDLGGAVVDLREMDAIRSAVGRDAFINLLDERLDEDSRTNVLDAIESLPEETE